MATKTAATATNEDASTGPKVRQIVIHPMHKTLIQVPIIGATPLLMGQMGEAAKNLLAAAGLPLEQRPKKSKVRDPEAECEDAIYYLPDGRYGFPASAIKKAMAEAARYFEGLYKTEIHRQVRVPAEYIAVIFEGKPKMRRDVARNRQKGAVLVYRPEFFPWRMTVPLIVDQNSFSVDSAVNLLAKAGNHIGIGPWRPDKSGTFGTFDIDKSGPINVERIN